MLRFALPLAASALLLAAGAVASPPTSPERGVADVFQRNADGGVCNGVGPATYGSDGDGYAIRATLVDPLWSSDESGQVGSCAPDALRSLRVAFPDDFWMDAVHATSVDGCSSTTTHVTWRAARGVADPFRAHAWLSIHAWDTCEGTSTGSVSAAFSFL